MKEIEKQPSKPHCSECQNRLEVNEEFDGLVCNHCDKRTHQQPLQTPQQREAAYETIMQRVTNYKIKKGATSEHKYILSQSEQLEPLIQKEFSPSFHSMEPHLDDNSDQQEERLKEQQNQLREVIRLKNLDIKAQKKIIVGSGFTFDMTDFFQFKKKELVHSESQNFFQSISGSRIAWLILLYTICSSAFIPGWIMNIKANKFLRQCWRAFMQTLMVIPFVLHEKRTASAEDREKYSLRYIFNRANIIKPFMSSFSSSLWILCIFMSFQWTYVCHGIILGSLSNFFLSLNRSINKNSHDLELGGQVLIIVGIVLLILDGLSLSPEEIEGGKDYLNTYFLTRTWWERLGGEILALTTSFMMSQFSKYTSDLRNYYPPFLLMLIVNCFNVINITLISFFFNGTSFDQDSFWGIFSVFTDTHFISFMYMAIVLAFGQMVSVVLVSKMFPDPIIPALAMTLQPFFACFFIDLTRIQSLPRNFQMGFILLLPGMFLVLMGQCFYQRQKSYQQESDNRVKHLLDEIKQLKETMKERETHIFMRQHRRLSSVAHNKDEHLEQRVSDKFMSG